MKEAHLWLPGFPSSKSQFVCFQFPKPHLTAAVFFRTLLGFSRRIHKKYRDAASTRRVWNVRTWAVDPYTNTAKQNFGIHDGPCRDFTLLMFSLPRVPNGREKPFLPESLERPCDALDACEFVGWTYKAHLPFSNLKAVQRFATDLSM